MTIDKERLRALASDCTSHPLSQHITQIEEAGEGLYALLSENAALAAENERLRKDAARYCEFFTAGLPITFLGVDYYDKPSLDAAIDAIRADKGGAAS